MAWRRYNKHSRNKSGEIAGALLPLRATYSSCRFAGAILAGEYTAGGKNQLLSEGIHVLHIPFAVLAASFLIEKIDLAYAENASSDDKRRVIAAWEALSERQIAQIRQHLREAIRTEYTAFTQQLAAAISQTIDTIRILPLFGSAMSVTTTPDAVIALNSYSEQSAADQPFVRYEIQILFSNGDKIDGTFRSKEQALAFLTTFA